MDSIIMLLKEKFKNFSCIHSYEDTLKSIKIETKEGIRYICYMEEDKEYRNYYLYNRYFEKRCRLGIKTLNSKYFNENIMSEIFKDYILRNEIVYKAFKEGMKAFKEKKCDYDISALLNYNLYLEYIKENKLDKLLYYIWNKGYEFASKFPNPDIIEMQYEFLKKKAIENINIETIMEFMLINKDIHIYLDEKKVSEKVKELDNVNEIEYSYGHIVAKAKTYDIKMNLLPLDGEIIIFDTEGINEIAICNVKEYWLKYKDSSISEMFKAMRNFEKENFIGMEKLENEQ